MRVPVLFAAAFFTAGLAQAAPAEWSLDRAHSEVGFKVRHLGIANVRGHFKTFDAKVLADAKSGRVTSVEATAQAASIDTGVEKRDGHLRSDDFFNAEKYPTLKATLSDLRWKGNKVEGKAKLTIRDVTKTVPVTGELLGTHKVNFGDGDQIRAGYTFTTTVNRKAFGLRFNAMAEGVAVVADEVTIEIQLEISRRIGTPAG